MMALSGESKGVVGDWKLEGNQLVTDMRAISNEFGAGNIFGAINTSTTNRVAKLTDSVMVWRGAGELQGMTLKRVTVR